MSRYQRFMVFGAAAVIVCAAAAQVAPVCCKYIGNWPPEENPSGACAGSTSTLCITAADDGSIVDPLSRKYFSNTTPARCITITLSGSATFVQQPCSWPPPQGWISMPPISLPNGQCCYVVGQQHEVSFSYTTLNYNIPVCSGNCGGTLPE